MTLSALKERASVFHAVLFGQFINFLWKEPNLPLPWGRSWAQDIYAAWLLDQLPLRNAFHFHVYHCSLCVLSRDPHEHELWYFRAVAVKLCYNFTIYFTLGPRWAQRGMNAASNERCWPVSGVKRARKRNKRVGKQCTKEKAKTEQQRQEWNV